LTVAAVAAIFRQRLGQSGLAQADRNHEGPAETFAFPAEYPRVAREREEIRNSVRIYPSGLT